MTPNHSYEEFSAEAPEGHPEVLESFAESILDGGDLIADGHEGLNSLLISNAAYLSSWTNDWANIPADETMFEKYLEQLRSQESTEKNAVPLNVGENMSERWKVRW